MLISHTNSGELVQTWTQFDAAAAETHLGDMISQMERSGDITWEAIYRGILTQVSAGPNDPVERPESIGARSDLAWRIRGSLIRAPWLGSIRCPRKAIRLPSVKEHSPERKVGMAGTPNAERDASRAVRLARSLDVRTLDRPPNRLRKTYAIPMLLLQ
jgi:hypothetical protein